MLFSFRLKATRHEKADTKFNTSSWHKLGCASRNCRNYRTRTRFDRHHQHTKCFPLPGASIPSEAMMHSPLFQNYPYFRKKFQTPCKIFPIWPNIFLHFRPPNYFWWRFFSYRL